MKKLITFLFVTASVASYAQPKVLTQAIITTKTTIVSPEEDDNAPNTSVSGNGGEEMRVMRFGGDGETKTTTWLKNDMVKTYSESEMGLTTAIRDNGKKLTTTIMEMMGRKFGFYATDEDQEQIRKRMDSMMQSRRSDNMQAITTAMAAPASSDIVYLEESKKIAGYDCKRALIINTRSNGKKDTTAVWYVPDMKLQNIPSTGGSLGGFGGMSPQVSSNGFDKLNGFPMLYERTMNRGRKMTVQVTKLVTDKEINDKEFEIPKDVDIKPAKEMQGGGGQGFQIRMGG